VTVRYRRGSPEDDRAIHAVFIEAVNEIDRRLGTVDAFEPGDRAAIEADWAKRRTLFEHLGATADEQWVAEDEAGIVGYARSILRGGLRELTEYFVMPGRQGGGVGRELLDRAFPAEGAEHRAIIATFELPALSRYLRTGLGARSVIGNLYRRPEAARVETDLVAEPAVADEATMDVLGAVDLEVLGHRRDVDHGWLLAGRQGILHRRDGRVVGYGYVGAYSGPFAALDPADLPAIVADGEARAAAAGNEDFGLWLPLVNATLAAWLLDRGYRLDPFLVVLLSDAPMDGLDRYVVTSPPFFL
jgi:GNAT superfamily N-acetyltransferase